MPTSTVQDSQSRSPRLQASLTQPRACSRPSTPPGGYPDRISPAFSKPTSPRYIIPELRPVLTSTVDQIPIIHNRQLSGSSNIQEDPLHARQAVRTRSARGSQSSSDGSPSTKAPPRKVHIVDSYSDHLDEQDYHAHDTTYVAEDNTEYSTPQVLKDQHRNPASIPGSHSRSASLTQSPQNQRPGKAAKSREPSPPPVAPTSNPDPNPLSQEDATRRLFQTVYKAGAQDEEIPQEANVKDGTLREDLFLPALQDYNDRGANFSFSDRSPSFDNFQLWLDEFLRTTDIVVDDASQLGNHFFLVLFKDSFHKERAFTLSYWFQNRFVDMYPWTPEFSPLVAANQVCPIWIEFPKLQSTLRHKLTLLSIAEDHLGRVLLVPRTNTLTHHTNPRLLIRWPMAEAPRDFLKVTSADGHFNLRLIFLNHPQAYHKCKGLSHQARLCPNPPHFLNYRQKQPSPPRTTSPA